jgi:hypothetical protein
MTASTDYLVIGCGATALSFVDAMLHESDATFTIVDRRHAPGGHWNDAYPFVRLHQPASYYGVASKALGREQIEVDGFNRGLYELSTGVEVASYYHTLMRDVFLPSGRVTYLPLSEYTREGDIVGLLSRERRSVQARRKIVDATLTETSIPLTHQRQFSTGEGVVCIAPNDLPRRAPRYARFAVLGSGKTAIDSVSFLLANGVRPSAIHWVRPRDPWIWNRKGVQPATLFTHTASALADHFEIIAQSDSLRTLAERANERRIWLRLDDDVWPEMFHGALTTEAELEQLRRVEQVIRFGRVQQIERERLTLQRGTVDMHPDTLYVDCTAQALGRNVGDLTPVFAPGRISLQMVRMFQPTFSAALIGHIEASNLDEVQKTALLEPVPMTDTLADWARAQAGSIRNQLRCAAHPSIRTWVERCRLDAYNKWFANARPEDTEILTCAQRFRGHLPKALRNLERFSAA